MKKKKILKKKPKLPAPIVVAVAIAIVGVAAIVQSHAATFATASETESGTIAGNATTTSDSNASGGQAVQFGSQSSGIPFNHCTNPTYTIPSSLSNPQSGVSIGNYYVDNDSWNFSKYPTSSQTIYVCSYNNWYATVNVSDTANNGEVKTYPSVHDDFNSPALSSFTTISSIYAQTPPSSGAWDMAYDIWINNYATELMIWTHSSGRQAHVPGIPQVGTVTLSGITYNIHKSGSYIAYDMPTARDSGTINIKEVINDMISRGYITSGSTLSSIQYGVEVCDVGGVNTNFVFNNFSVTAN